MSAASARAISIADKAAPVHCRGFTDTSQSYCGRARALIKIAEETREITCRRCLGLLRQEAKRDSDCRLAARMKRELRAKASFDILMNRAPRGISGDIWEREGTPVRLAFCEIVEFLHDLFLDDDLDRRTRAWRERHE